MVDRYKKSDANDVSHKVNRQAANVPLAPHQNIPRIRRPILALSSFYRHLM
jgi:hypothetical protein